MALDVMQLIRDLRSGLEISKEYETDADVREHVFALEERLNVVETMVKMDAAECIEVSGRFPTETVDALRSIRNDIIAHGEDFVRRHGG